MPTIIELGKSYRERVHGRSGVATAVVKYLTGCDQVCLEWLGVDDEMKDCWVDTTTIMGNDSGGAGGGLGGGGIAGGPQNTPPKQHRNPSGG